jgi:membrane-associated phospholipid phosphatase
MMQIINFSKATFLSMVLILLSSGLRLNLYAQTDSTSKCSINDYIAPAVLVAYGTIAISNKNVKAIDLDVKEAIQGTGHTTIDNYLPFVPSLSVYVLKLNGVKSKSNFNDYTIKAGISYVINTAIVHTLKKSTQILRPDGSTNNSFPSGHTSSAFVSAELLHQEYGQQSVWYSLAGYTIATATGYLRIYNNRHWFSDVVMGAGLGMLTTKFTYWAYPTIKKWVNKKDKDVAFLIAPTPYGIALVYQLK